MTTKNTRRGFTLIELLVVVLIIGLLAAVALPQYNRAVTKARGAEALEAMDALDKALTAYYLEHGTYEGANTNTLDVHIPELTHFKYAIGTNSFIMGTSSFPEIRDKKPRVFIISPSGVYLSRDFENGKANTVYCNPTDECQKFFNCNWIQVTSSIQCAVR